MRRVYYIYDTCLGILIANKAAMLIKHVHWVKLYHRAICNYYNESKIIMLKHHHNVETQI